MGHYRGIPPLEKPRDPGVSRSLACVRSAPSRVPAPARTWHQPHALEFLILSTIHLAAAFPYYLRLGARSAHPHLFFEALGYVAAFIVFLLVRNRFSDAVAVPVRWATLAAAFVGGTIGSKLLYWLEDPSLTLQHLHDPSYLIEGKTIVGALLGGVFAVEAMKRYIGFQQSTGDLLAIPVAVGLAIGRIGCFLTGLSDNTYGTQTSLPWGVDFGDGVCRHPTQLYEIVLLLALTPLLTTVLRFTSKPATRAQRPPSTILPGDTFKVFMVGYLGFRFFCDYIKPYQRVALGLGAIQWACLIGLLYYTPDICRWLRPPERTE